MSAALTIDCECEWGGGRRHDRLPGVQGRDADSVPNQKGKAMKTENAERRPLKVVLELRSNGDPYGRGYVASESRDGGLTWVYRGDVGAASREWWRREARRIGAQLREVRGGR